MTKTRLQIIAGPCSAETPEQMMRTAKELYSVGVRTFRAGLWKPRSRFGTFEGVGSKGLEWMKDIQQELGMEVMTEVALPSHVEAVLKAEINGVWIGARTSVNPFLMAELAESLRGVDIPVWVKNPLAPDLQLWIGAIERLSHANVKQLGAIHRGFTLLNNAPYRNTPVWDVVEQMHQYLPNLPILCDPSHIAGASSLVKEICTKALEYPISGFCIESHYHPEIALSDAKQQLTPKELAEMLPSLEEKYNSKKEIDILAHK